MNNSLYILIGGLFHDKRIFTMIFKNDILFKYLLHDDLDLTVSLC